MRNVCLSVLLSVLAVVLIGCESAKPRARPWNVVLNKTTPASIEVDLIGVNNIARPAWEGYDVDQYWTPGDSRRANTDKLTINLPTGQPWMMRKDDPHWQSWLDHGATELLILANLPGSFPSGPTDPRRLFLPLDKKHWKAKDDTLEIEVQDTIVHPTTP